MKKRELLKLPVMLATNKMMQMAAEDTPSREKYYIWEKYKTGLYIRCGIHGKILKAAFFLTEHMRSGGRNPAYELFVSRERRQFITYDRLHDKWLDAKLDMLPWPGYVGYSEQKWIKQTDYIAVKKYLDSDKGGFEGILKFQLKIREDELVRRHKRETDKWDLDLAQVPELPKDWERWVNKVGIRQNYIFYKYDKKGADTGYCSYCEKEVPVKRPRYNKQGYCSRCRHEITFKAIGRVGHLMTERNQMYLIQRCKDGFVIRQFQGYRIYQRGEHTTPQCICSEIRRSIFDGNGKALRAYYWGLYKQREMRWISTGICSTGYWGDQDGKVYGKTLPSLAHNELSRTGLIEAIAGIETIDPEKYLAVLKAVPMLEKLAKARLPRLVNECMYSYHSFKEKVHNAQASSLTKMLGINTHEMKRLRRNSGDLAFLDWLKYEKATEKVIPDSVIIWFCNEKIGAKNLQFILGKMSTIQVCNYIRRQMSVYKKTSKEVLITWSDYLFMAKRLKMDTDDEIIFRVNKLFQRHNELVERCHEKGLAIQAGEILEMYPHVDDICESLREKYEYADNDYSVRAPSRIEDILLEARTLHHCADGDRYFERIERRESYVLFLRRSSEPDKSYYTLEVEPNGTIRQKRTMFDRQEADIEDAKKFLTKWQKEISKRLTAEDEKLAEESRALRDVTFEQLRRDQVIIHTGQLAGKLLVDVLLADLMETVAV